MILLLANRVIVKGIMGAWILILLWLFVFLLALSIYMKQKVIEIPLFITIIAVYMLLQSHMRKYTENIPLWSLIVFCIFLSIWGLYRIYQVHVWQKTHITNISIKQAVDKISFGVCYYNEQGRILLINQTMNDFCEQILGEPVQNGLRTFGQILAMGSVVFLPDDRAISFYSKKCIIDSEQVELVTAFDISEEYKKTNILMQKEEELKEVNEKLTSYNHEMVSVIALKEVLNAKVKIHDELGSSLLAIKKYLLQGGTKEERVHLIEGLRKNVRFLRQESEENIYDEYEMIMKTADDIGMNIEITGELPKDKKIRHIACTAMHECLTNTIRYALGDTLYVTVLDCEESYKLIYTNNGLKPEGPITEKGGLISLRNLVEQIKGNMTISTIDQFKLEIELFKGDK